MRSENAKSTVRQTWLACLAACAIGSFWAGGRVAQAQAPGMPGGMPGGMPSGGMPAGGAGGGSSAAPGAGAAAKVIGIGFTVTFAVIGANYLLASAICAPSERAERPKKRKDD